MTPAASLKTVLVLGSGAREHALAQKIASSPLVERVIVAPGNDGMPKEWERWELSSPSSTQGGGSLPSSSSHFKVFEALARRAREAQVALTVVGPDQYLADGVVDVFRRQGLLIFGPTAAAARIESSKAFAKEVMIAAGVPTARHVVVGSVEAAQAFLAAQSDCGWVAKADGLALGKGVRVCENRSETLEAVRDLLELGPVGSAQVLIEEKLRGEELSWMAFCDGERCALLDPARDHKRLGEGDRGPNTGGMGAVSPVPGVAPELAERMQAEVFLPVLREMKARAIPFQGVLYAGLMIDTAAGPPPAKYGVLEFNARWGDPEAQVLLARMQGDLMPWLLACAKGALGELAAQVPFKDTTAVYVVAAAPGYPGTPIAGQKISGARAGDAGVFFAGVRERDGELQVSGGRVLGVLGESPGATRDSLESARTRAYQKLSQIRFEGMQWRADIGERADPSRGLRS